MPKVQALLDSVKMLELRDWRRGETVRKINEGNINTTRALEAMRANLTLHEHRVTDWIDPSALHDHDHDARGFPVELGHGEHGEDGDEDDHGRGGRGGWGRLHSHTTQHVFATNLRFDRGNYVFLYRL